MFNSTNTHNDADLISTCPIYLVMDAAPKALEMARLQSAIDKILGD